jgi:hypothetical protein
MRISRNRLSGGRRERQRERIFCPVFGKSGGGIGAESRVEILPLWREKIIRTVMQTLIPGA